MRHKRRRPAATFKRYSLTAKRYILTAKRYCLTADKANKFHYNAGFLGRTVTALSMTLAITHDL